MIVFSLTETASPDANPTANEFFGVSSALSGSLGMIGTTYTSTSKGAV